jgi:hypothetical protein
MERVEKMKNGEESRIKMEDRRWNSRILEPRGRNRLLCEKLHAFYL